MEDCGQGEADLVRAGGTAVQGAPQEVLAAGFGNLEDRDGATFPGNAALPGSAITAPSDPATSGVEVKVAAFSTLVTVTLGAGGRGGKA